MSKTKIDKKDEAEILELLEAKAYNLKYRKFYSYYFQDEMIDINGCDISRHAYAKYIDFMNKGSQYRERAAVAANRAGKTDMIAFEVACHLTKDYPDWWQGKKFDGPIIVVCVGKTNLAIRDVVQDKLIGKYKLAPGTGLLPLAENNGGVGVVKTTSKQGTADAVQDIYIRDRNGDINSVWLRSQELDAGVFMGTAVHVVWFDEECLNRKLYEEAKTRTVTTHGIVVHTFTPLDGMTQTLMEFMPGRKFPENGIVKNTQGEPTGQYCVNFPLPEAPHMTKEMLDYHHFWVIEVNRER